MCIRDRSQMSGHFVQYKSESHLRPLQHVETLLKRNDILKEKREQEQQKKSEEELKQCTFKPKINRKESTPLKVGKMQREGNISERLYDQNFLKRREDAKLLAEAERMVQDEQQCTFQPQIIRERMEDEQVNICLTQFAKRVSVSNRKAALCKLGALEVKRET
eukprot:TRINITY_DN21183_c0_g1_i1.p3 TRINITY_DN21183_c0_g1~~TRINITY_DN21183_c0_g1_i1.p3  ORF type:complete len:163 (-),score=5.52 TRINITY_DN21183_c0_g1_i1:111-599(-)